MGGKVEHPSLQKFLLERSLYEHVGLNFDSIRTRPMREIIDYITIVNLIENERGRARAQEEARMSAQRQTVKY